MYANILHNLTGCQNAKEMRCEKMFQSILFLFGARLTHYIHYKYHYPRPQHKSLSLASITKSPAPSHHQMAIMGTASRQLPTSSRYLTILRSAL